MEFVTQRRTWKETGKLHDHSDAQYAEFPRSWSTRAGREWQEMDYMFRINRIHLGERTQLQGVQIPYQRQTLPKVRVTAVQRTIPRLTWGWEQHQLHQHEEASMQRTSRRRVMIVSNPDPTDDSEGEFDMMIRKC